jgi:hypothetical protein
MSTAVTNGLLNIKIQIGENEDLLEKRFFNEKRNCHGRLDCNDRYSFISFLY